MVGATGIEPVTPAMSRQCSTAELRAHRRSVRSSYTRQRGSPVVYIAARGLARARRVTRPAPRAMSHGMEFSPVPPDHEALDCRLPTRQTVPVVVASPHSGSIYPAAFLAQAAVPLAALRRAEDAFVDELFGAAPSLGMPLLAARFPRSYVDANREPYELDPGHVRGAAAAAAQSPHHARRRGPRHDPARGRQRRGDLSRPRSVRRDRAPAGDLLAALSPDPVALVEQTYSQFGGALLIDAHSMPSSASSLGPRDRDHRVDIVLGDNHGESCAPELVDCAERWLAAPRPAGPAQPALCRRLHDPALRPSGPRPPRSADRNQSGALHGRDPPREAAGGRRRRTADGRACSRKSASRRWRSCCPRPLAAE